jgi:hypothetical protein
LDGGASFGCGGAFGCISERRSGNLGLGIIEFLGFLEGRLCAMHFLEDGVDRALEQENLV